jgi:hypothetical protein
MKMDNAALKIVVEVSRADGSLAQQVVFHQLGMTYEQLLELQAKAVMPCTDAVRAVVAGWAAEAAQISQAKKNEGRLPTSGPSGQKG